MEKQRCTHKDEDIVEMFGIPVDACHYEEIERYKNVTVSILQCPKCGHVEIVWKRQENTERIL